MATTDDVNELHLLGSNWGKMTAGLRRRWCQAQLDFPPVWLGTIFMTGASRAVRSRRYATISWWVGVAREFDAAGFTPDQYYILRMCISDHLSNGPREHPLIYISNIQAPREYIRARDWIEWLAMVKSGLTPMRATSAVMSPDDRTWQLLDALNDRP